MRSAFQTFRGPWHKTFSDEDDLILLLKAARVGACLTSCSRLFQSFGPRKDIALCTLLVFRKGIERSVSVVLSSLTFRVDFFSIGQFKLCIRLCEISPKRNRLPGVFENIPLRNLIFDDRRHLIVEVR